eukprot:15367146-Ditylum_brightwellii.AAC.1
MAKRGTEATMYSNQLQPMRVKQDMIRQIEREQGHCLCDPIITSKQGCVDATIQQLDVAAMNTINLDLTCQ